MEKIAHKKRKLKENIEANNKIINHSLVQLTRQKRLQLHAITLLQIELHKMRSLMSLFAIDERINLSRETGKEMSSISSDIFCKIALNNDPID